MKQELSTTENKASSTFSHPPVLPARSRVSKAKDSPRTESANVVSPGLKARPRLVPPEANNTHRARKSVFVGAPKEREMEDPKVAGWPRNRAVEQFARLRRRPDTTCKGAEEEIDGKTKELQQRVFASERLVEELQSEVSTLKAQLEKLQSRNLELESQNKGFAENLWAAEAKISVLENRNQVESHSKEVQPSEFKDVQKLIANKLENLRAKKEVSDDDRSTRMPALALDPGAKAKEIQPKVMAVPFPPPPPARHVPVTGPPPPPPPPPRSASARANTMQKAPTLVEFYHSLTKRDAKKDALGCGSSASPGANNAHNSIVGEIQNRSAHLLAIKADVRNKGDFIKFLIEKVRSAAYTDIEDVLTFVDWLDGELSTLADERAVLKHFNWPERKADALREAAFEYRDLKQLEVEVSSFEDDTSMPCEATLKKSANLLDKLERGTHRLTKLRDATILTYKECEIPTDWMLDSGMVSKLKLASVKLAKVYMKRVSMELESVRHSERESTQEALLFQGVRFAYRAHQFAGGLDSETMCAFEELRNRIQSHGRGSREILPGITLS